MTDDDVNSEGIVNDSIKLMEFCEDNNWPMNYALAVMAVSAETVFHVRPELRKEFNSYLRESKEAIKRGSRMQ